MGCKLSRLAAACPGASTTDQICIVDANGVGIAGQYSHADIAAALEEAVSALRIGVRDMRTGFIGTVDVPLSLDK